MAAMNRLFKLRLNTPSHFRFLLGKPYSTSSALVLDSLSDSAAAQLSRSETVTLDKLHSLISENPNPNPNPPTSADFTIPSLSCHFSNIAATKPISPALITAVIQKCGAVPFAQALAFFNWAETSNLLLDSPEPYHEMIELAGKFKRFDIAWHLIDTMKRKCVEISIHTFSIFILRYMQAGLVSEAVHSFNRMEEYGHVPDPVTFSTVIIILCNKGRMEEAQAFFDSMKDKFEANIMDIFPYTSLVQGWCRAGKMEEAERIFGEMKMAGIIPHVPTYTIFIDALCKCGQITRAHEVFADMLHQGRRPNPVTFNILMRVHVKAGRTEKVFQLYKQMKKLSCEPDRTTYNMLIDAHCRDDEREKAIKVINRMVRKKCPPNACSFNPIFKCIEKAKDANEAHRLYMRMRELNCKLNTATFNTLMKIYADAKLADVVSNLKEQMDWSDSALNINTYKILISFYCGMGNWDFVYMYFEEMIEYHELRPSKEIYEMVFRELKKAGEMKKHEELVEKMVARGFLARPLE